MGVKHLRLFADELILKSPSRTCFSQLIVCHCIIRHTRLQFVFEMQTLHNPFSTFGLMLLRDSSSIVFDITRLRVQHSQSGVTEELPAFQQLNVIYGLHASHLRPVTNDNRMHSQLDGQTVQCSTSKPPAESCTAAPVCMTVTYLRRWSNRRPEWQQLLAVINNHDRICEEQCRILYQASNASLVSDETQNKLRIKHSEKPKFRIGAESIFQVQFSDNTSCTSM